MKRFFLILLAAMLMLPGCAEEPRETGFGYALYDEYREEGIEMEDFSDNLEYDYIKWSYCGWYRFDPTEEEREQGIQGDAWCSDWNLTMTAMKTHGSIYVRGVRLLDSLDDYNAVMNAIAATKATAIQNCGAYQEPVEIQRTWEGSFDEAFFEEYSLILIDHCYEGNTFLRSRLDRMTKTSGEMAVEISWETVHAATADQPGEVYWIIVPKPLGHATVEYTETAWNH